MKKSFSLVDPKKKAFAFLLYLEQHLQTIDNLKNQLPITEARIEEDFKKVEEERKAQFDEKQEKDRQAFEEKQKRDRENFEKKRKTREDNFRTAQVLKREKHEKIDKKNRDEINRLRSKYDPENPDHQIIQ